MRKTLSKAGERGVAKAVALPVLLLTGLVGHADEQTPSPRSFRISVNVDLVVLHATVTDRQGDRV
jgi:hypothetical protein